MKIERTRTALGPLVAVAFCLPLWLACQVGDVAPEGGDPGEDDLSAGPDAGAVAAVCEPSNVASTVFGRKCSGGACHDADQPAAGLDLQSTGLAARLAGVTSSCGGAVLVVAGDPSTSYLVDKLDGSAQCGQPMPAGGAPLSAEEMDCVTGWIEALTPGGGGGEPPGGGTDY